jgi:MATE family multidrug resistance protein
MLSVGVPSGLIFVLDSGMFAMGTMMMAKFGVDALAAHSIALQCASFVYAIPMGLSMAVALQVGHAVGAQDFMHAKRVGYIGLMLALIFAVFIGIIFIGFPNALVKIFLDSNVYHYSEIKQLTVTFLFIAALFQAFDVIQAVMNGALRGFKDTLFPMLFCVSCFWGAGIGGAYLLAFHFHFNAIGIWIGLTLGLFSASAVLFLRFVYKPTLSLLNTST